MNKYIKQVIATLFVIFTTVIIIPNFSDIDAKGILRMSEPNLLHILSSVVIIAYLLYRIYKELSDNKLHEHKFTRTAIMIILAFLILVNNIIISTGATPLSVKLSILFRFLAILGLINVLENYVFKTIISKYKVVFTTLMSLFIILLFIFTFEFIPIIAAGYYLLGLVYLMLNFIQWHEEKSVMMKVRFCSVVLIAAGLINDVIVIVYNMSVEVSFIVSAMGIVIIYLGKLISVNQYYQIKLREIKALKVELTKLSNKNQEIEVSTTRVKNELASRFNMKQNYYENLELVIDVLNTNILVINEAFKVELSYGNAFNYDEVVGLEISKALFDVFNDEAQYFQSVLKKVFDAEDDVRENLFLSLLDQKLTIQNVSYAMQYYVMKKHNDEKVLIMHAEHQTTHDYMDQHHQEKDIANMVTAVVRNSEMFFSDLSSFIDFTKHITAVIDREDSLKDNIFKVLRRVHTYKGVFDQYNMSTTVRGIHDIENELFNTLHNIDGLTFDQFSRVLIAYDLESVLRTDMMILKQRIGERFFNYKTKLSVDITAFDRTYLSLSSLLGQDHQLVKEMAYLKQVDMKEILESYNEYVLRLAEDQGKLVDFVVKGDHVKINRKSYIGFFEGLIHILRNSVTHGVEYPDERTMLGKDRQATITCSVKHTNNVVQLLITDDGRGIDIKEIKNRLFILGKYTIEELEDLTDDEIANMVIEDGVTSYAAPTTVAGRGVGMGSIREIVDAVHGEIKVRSQRDVGVTYEINLPMSLKEPIIRVDSQKIVQDLCLQAERVLTKSERKSTLSSTWHYHKQNLNEELLFDVSAIVTVRSYLDRKIMITVDESFLFQLIGSYGMSIKYKGSNLKVMNEVVCLFIEDIIHRTVNALKGDQHNIEIQSPIVASQKIFDEVFNERLGRVAELDISEGKLRIIVLEH